MTSVTVDLGEFAVESLAGEGRLGRVHVQARMARAIRCYLGDRSAGRPGWRYPMFLQGQSPDVHVKVDLDVDEELWGEFEAEAEAQEVTVEQLAEHAALYLAAEVNAGRVTERILDDLEESE